MTLKVLALSGLVNPFCVDHAKWQGGAVEDRKWNDLDFLRQRELGVSTSCCSRRRIAAAAIRAPRGARRPGTTHHGGFGGAGPFWSGCWIASSCDVAYCFASSLAKFIRIVLPLASFRLTVVSFDIFRIALAGPL